MGPAERCTDRPSIREATRAVSTAGCYRGRSCTWFRFSDLLTTCEYVSPRSRSCSCCSPVSGSHPLRSRSSGSPADEQSLPDWRSESPECSSSSRRAGVLAFTGETSFPRRPPSSGVLAAGRIAALAEHVRLRDERAHQSRIRKLRQSVPASTRAVTQPLRPTERRTRAIARACGSSVRPADPSRAST